jgi:hypothetical protein
MLTSESQSDPKELIEYNLMIDERAQRIVGSFAQHVIDDLQLACLRPMQNMHMCIYIAFYAFLLHIIHCFCMACILEFLQSNLFCSVPSI